MPAQIENIQNKFMSSFSKKAKKLINELLSLKKKISQ